MRENRRMIDDDTSSLKGPTAPRALSIDEEWAIIQALDVEHIDNAHAIAPASTTHVEDLSYLEPILYPPSVPSDGRRHSPSSTTRRWRWRWWRLIAVHNLIGIGTLTYLIVTVCQEAISGGAPEKAIIPLVFLCTLWWFCIPQTIYVAATKRFNPRPFFHIAAGFLSLVAATITGFLSAFALYSCLK